MAVQNSELGKKLDTLITEVAIVKQQIVDKKELCPYREDIHDGVLAKAEAAAAKEDAKILATVVNGKLDAIRKDIKDMNEKITDNKIGIKTWGGIIAGTSLAATALVKIAESMHL